MNIAIITLGIVLSAVFTFLSLSSFVREKRSDVGLLQSAICTFYVAFLTLSALSTEPRNWISGSKGYPHHDFTLANKHHWSHYLTKIIGALLTVFTLLWSTFRAPKVSLETDSENEDNTIEMGNDGDNSEEQISYSCSLFHFIYGLVLHNHSIMQITFNSYSVIFVKHYFLTQFLAFILINKLIFIFL